MVLASIGREVARPGGTPQPGGNPHPGGTQCYSLMLAVCMEGDAHKRLSELVLGCREDTGSPKASLMAHTRPLRQTAHLLGKEAEAW